MVLVLSAFRILIKQESPWAAQQRQLPANTQLPWRRRDNDANSVSTKEGTVDRLSVTLSTRICTSTLATCSSIDWLRRNSCRATQNLSLRRGVKLAKKLYFDLSDITVHLKC